LAIALVRKTLNTLYISRQLPPMCKFSILYYTVCGHTVGLAAERRNYNPLTLQFCNQVVAEMIRPGPPHHRMAFWISRARQCAGKGKKPLVTRVVPGTRLIGSRSNGICDDCKNHARRQRAFLPLQITCTCHAAHYQEMADLLNVPNKRKG